MTPETEQTSRVKIRITDDGKFQQLYDPLSKTLLDSNGCGNKYT